jgi:LysR family transcriptional regulator, nod-box dependent transcriptional activator
MRFKGLDLNLLVTLDVLFQELNVTHAAARLNTTQSTVSGMLARLRTHFQDELLVPYGRVLRMTSLAEQLQGPLHEAILRLETIVSADGGFDPASSDRHFRVEFPDHLTTYLLPTITRDIAENAPHVTIEFSLPRGDPAPLLYRGELDLVVTPQTYRAPDYLAVEFWRDDLVVVGWAGNAQFEQDMTPELLAAMPMISVKFNPNNISARLTGDQLHLIEGGKNLKVVAPSFSSIPLMLVGTPYFSFLHRNLARYFRDRLPIVLRELPFNSPSLLDVIMYHPNRANDRGLMWLIERLAAAARHHQTMG